MSVSASDWVKGISLSVVATIIGGASKLAIRKSWLMEASLDEEEATDLSAQVVTQVDDENINMLGIDDSTSTSTNYQLQLQPLEHMLHTDETIKIRRTALGLRLFGMVGMTFLNPFCGVLAMNYASPSITAPFSGLTLVWIVMCSNTFIGEQPSDRQIVAASLIVLGEVVVAIFGDHTNDEGITLEDLERSYSEPAFIIYLVGISFWMALLMYWVHYSTSVLVKRFAWGVAGGAVTGIQNFLKDTLTIIKAREGIPWYFPVFLMLSIGVAFGGLLLLTACMKRYDVTYSSSMFVGAYIVSASVMSAAHYNTFANLETLINYFMYPIGLLILMAGVWILVKETEEECVEVHPSPIIQMVSKEQM